ncbi:MAG: magnesium-translocating P-type ATPase [Evtepia sp.]|nr:magnesium-translocating P-type ATPase [Evtepia sp.]MDY3014836.1 magnesium-translocating P-type ATPase [Evtepia sp.]
MKKYAHASPQELYRDLSTSPQGLSPQQAEAMAHAYGRNILDPRESHALLHGFRRAFLNPFTIILAVIALISLVTDVLLASNLTRNVTTFLILLVMILLSGAIRLTQEMHAIRAVRQLDRMVHTKVTVRRCGVLVEIPAEDLVVGDVVCLSAGDRVPADLRLVKTTDLFLSQSAITGESAILEKSSRTISYEETTPLPQLENLAFLATTVISGKGEGVVVAVGKDTLYGSFLRTQHPGSTAFEKGANSIAGVMIRFMAVLVPVVFVISGLSRGDWLNAFVFALSVAVGLTPEILPMVISACLARGSTLLSRKQTIVKNINAMQAFGSMDVLCMDKTGTLTQDGILLEYYMDILGNESPTVLDAAFLNSHFHSGVHNPIDTAILACQTMPGREDHFRNLAATTQKLDELPFDYSRKVVTVLTRDSQGRQQLLMKGDIREVLARCRQVEYRGETLPLPDHPEDSVNAVVQELLEDGMKVIAVARKDTDQQETLSLSQEKDMTLLGYLAFFDAPRTSAAASVAALKARNLTPKILTGDQAAVALSICRRVGISTQGLLTGEELNRLSDAQLRTLVEEIHVFAELTPGQKVRIMTALQDNGHTVGFLGDGLNDIPALMKADVGISVENAVDAAKDAASVLLLHKDLGVLEQGILEGRKTFVNMLKYIKITASSNFGNILSIVCASAFLPFLPMMAVQLLLLNLLYDALCIVLPFDRVDPEEFLSPHDWSGKTLGRFMLSFGPISSLFDIATFLFLYFFLCPTLCGGPFAALTPGGQALFLALFHTGWFLESMWTQVLILHLLRSKKLPFLQTLPSKPVLLVTLLGTLCFTAVTYTPLAQLLGLTALPLWYFAFLVTVVLLYLLLVSAAKARYLKKYHTLI